jgi:hypothetical protein
MIELQDKLEAYKERQKDRFKTKIYIIALWIIYGIIGAFFSYFVVNISNILIGIGYLGVLVTFFWYLTHFGAESYEMQICSYLSRALKLIKSSQKEKEKDAQRHRGKAADQISKALRELEKLDRRTKWSDIMEKNMHGRFSTLKNNIEKFVQPRVILGEDIFRMESTLEGLVKFFVEQWESLGIEHLDEINKNLESLGASSKEIRSLKSTLQELSKSKPAMISLSLIVGFGLTIAIAGGGCLSLSLDFVEWARLNLYVFILGGIALSALVSQILIRG